MTSLWLLVLANGRMVRNYAGRLDTGEKLRNLIFFGLLAIFFVSGTNLFGRIFRELLAVPMVGELLAFRLISMVFLTFGVMLLFSNAVTALSCLYLSRDMDFLLAQPVSMRTLYVYKYVQTTFHSSWMVLIFGGPVLVAYGRTVGAPWHFYPLSFLLLVPFSFIPAALGVFLINVIMYFVPLARIRYLLITIGFVFGGLLVSLIRMLNPRQLFDPRLLTNVHGYLASLAVPATPWLPNHFAATAVTQWAAGAGAAGPALLVAGLALGLSAVATVGGGFLYFHGMASGNQGSVGRRGKERVLVRGASVGRALMGKELAYFLREPTQWSQLLILLALIVVHLLNIRDLPLDYWYLQNLISFINLGLIGGVMAAVAVRFIFPTVSLEGEGLWIIGAAPIRLRALFWAKFQLHFWPLLLASELLAGLANWTLDAEPLMFALSAALVFALAAVLTALGLLLGALFPNFEYNHVSDIATSAGGMIYMMLALLYVGVSVSLVTVPVYAYFHERLNWRIVWAPVLASFGALAALNLVLFGVAVWWSRRALDGLFRR